MNKVRNRDLASKITTLQTTLRQTPF